MDRGSEPEGTPSEIADVLREAIRRRGLPLRTLQSRLRDRGHEISVSTLSQWQSGVRRPGPGSAEDVLRDLEEILFLDDGVLGASVRPRRRVPEDRHLEYQEHYGRVATAEEFFAEKLPRELSERSGTITYYLDRARRTKRTVNRTVFQGRIDGAQEVTVFYGPLDATTAPPSLRGTVGCELRDIVWNERLGVMRVTLRLLSPLGKGDVVVTERESTDHVSDLDLPARPIGGFAPRRQTEVGIVVVFDEEDEPPRCRAVITCGEDVRAVPLTANGNVVSHVEFDFGPGEIVIDWD